MCESKEKTFFKLVQGSAKEEASKEAKTRAKEKRSRLSLLLQKSELQEEPQARRSAPLARATRVCPEEAMRWGESFDKLLSHKDGLETFTQFLKTEFSEENIEFWMACEDFKKSKDPPQMILKAKAIYEKFIQNDAPQEVNVSGKVYNCLNIWGEDLPSSDWRFPHPFCQKGQRLLKQNGSFWLSPLKQNVL